MTATPSLLAIRRVAIAVSVLLWVGVLILIMGRASVHPHTLSTLSLLATACAVIVWALAQPAHAAAVSALTALGLAWAWGSGRGAGLVDEALGGLAVISVAVVTRRRWSRRIVRMRQLLADLEEERTVKDQAMAAVGQACETLQRKHGRYAQLQAIAEQLSSMTNLEAIAKLAVDRAFALIGKSDVCLLFLVDSARQTLSLVASKKRDAVPSVRAKHGDQFDRHVLRSHRPLLVDDIRRDFRFTVSPSTERPISAVIAAPLLVGQSPQGVLRLDSATGGAYTQDDLRFLDILLDLVAVAVANATLFAQVQQLAITDGLTGLSLRRPFLEQVTRALLRAARTRTPVSLLMLDVDRFKQYNDAFGHTAGDLLLKQMASTLRAVAPPDALSARYGGEEFALLLPRTSRADAARVAEAIRAAVEQRAGSAMARGQVATASEGLTVSLGVAAFPDDATKDLELIRIADQRLYQAKHAGRNRVVAEDS